MAQGHHRTAVAAAVAVASLAPAGARADGDPAEAQALHDRAFALMEQGRYEVACPMLGEAASLLPRSLPARSAEAECLARSGKLATALARYEAVEAEASREARKGQAAAARERVEALRARAARLTVTVPEALAMLPGAVVRLDGAPLSAARWGVAIPVDRGRHELAFAATGRRPHATTFDVDRDGDRYAISLSPSLAREAPAPLPARPAPEPPLRAREGSLIPGVAVLAAGAAGLGLGATAGALTLAKVRAIQTTCQGDRCPPSQAEQGRRAQTMGAVSTAALIAGAALSTAGLTLVLLRPFGRAAPPARLSAGPASIQLTGAFR